jgi:two-component system LytT family sensor kinase
MPPSSGGGAVPYRLMERTVGYRLRVAALVFLAWTAVGLFFFTQDLTRKALFGDPTPWWHFLVSWMIGIYLYALTTPVIIWLGRRFPIERRVWVRRVALHLAMSVLAATLQIVTISAVIAPLPILTGIKPHTFGAVLYVLVALSFHGSVATYWMVLGIHNGLRTWRRFQERERDALRLELHAAELDGQLAQAQLAGLKMQLQPHFLFNTLNAIMVLVRQQRTPQAEEMLARLSDLLRRVLDESMAQEVPLRRELELVELYLAIEEVRFKDRLRIDIAADPEVLDAAVPHFGLQPIIENAVRHGIGRRAAAGLIEIRAARHGDTLRLSVRDDGPGLGPAAAVTAVTAGEGGGGGRPGIGLANTRARLAQLYGGRASLAVADAAGGGAVATMELPFRLVPEVAVAEAIELWA